MKNRKRLIQKIYYLDKEFDTDIIKFLKSSRNQSDLIRSALLLQMRVANGEIDIDNIENKDNINKSTTKDKSNTIENTNITKEKELVADKNDINSFLQSCNIK